MPFLALLLIALAACASEPRPDAPSPASGEEAAPNLPPSGDYPEPPESLRIRVGVYPVPTSPMSLMIEVGAQDTASPNEPLGGVCVVGLAAYGDTAAEGAPAWRLRGETLACTPSPTMPVAGIDRRISATEILGDSLPPGPYHFTALVEARGDTFAVPGGRVFLSPDTLPPVRDRRALRYSVETRVEETAPRELVTRVAVTNTGPRRVEVQFGACSLNLRAYRHPARTGRPAFRSERRAPPFERGQGFGYACPLYLAGTVIAPGDTITPREFTLRIPFPEILGDSLPDGRYYFTAELEWLADRPTAGLDHDTVRLAAGEADLTSRVDPLPAERTVHGVRYVARTERVAGQPGKLRLSVAATNTGARDAVVGATPSAADCPMQLNGYATRERRDAWYLYATSEWTTRECPVRIPRTRLAPGESRAFSGLFTAPPQRRFLTLALWMAAPDLQTERIILSAGETP